MTKKEKAAYAKQWRLKNYEKRIEYERQYRKKPHAIEYNKEYYQKNKKEIEERKKKWSLKNKEKTKKYSATYRKKNIDKIRANCQTEKYKEHKKKYDKIYRSNNKEHRNKYLRDRRKTDFNFKLGYYLRTSLVDALKGKKKSKSALKLLGCSTEECWKYLESKFKIGMNRENHGKWHIDHIKPIAGFNLLEFKQQEKCFHYTNLQPLWAIDNLKKGAR